MESFNKLTPAQAERLALLAEECAEVIQAVTKILRHGYDSVNPYDVSATLNKEHLEREMGDLCHIGDLMILAGDVDGGRIDFYTDLKAERLSKYVHHQET